MQRFRLQEAPPKAVQKKLQFEQLNERDFFIDNLLVQIHFIIEMIRWTGLAPWEFEFSFPDTLISTLLASRSSFPHFQTRTAKP